MKNSMKHMQLSIVFDHFLQENRTHLLLIITRLAGSGKRAVRNSLNFTFPVEEKDRLAQLSRKTNRKYA